MSDSFFDMNLRNNAEQIAPLAERMRPDKLEELYGQEHIASPGKLLYRMITADKLSSIILSGPAGCGKTTLANIVAESTSSVFVSLNAVTSGVKDLKETIDAAQKRLSISGKRTILFIDEIHRFNKAQQDALLPAVEKGIIIMIGATTENPYFEINAALVSRSTVLTLKELDEADIKKIILSAIKNETKGLGKYDIRISEEAVDFWAQMANGDARNALNALELAYLTTPKNADGAIIIDLEVAQDCIQQRALTYDRGGDSHYDTISAFIKSMRGSDPDAAVYWLAKMLAAGEDPKFIARRMVIFASEDISCADSSALTLAISAFRAVEIIGLPEAQINLAHCAVYLSCAPKSNASCMALYSAQADIKKRPTAKIPTHLRSSGVPKANPDGRSAEYRYPHNYPLHYVQQDYLPKEFVHARYYEPTEMGNEKKLKAYLEYVRANGGEK